MNAEPELLFGALKGALAGRYVLERALGRGGMGMVYLAREIRLDRSVAIKLLPPAKAADAKARDRFLREAQTAAQLSHPHVVPIFTADHVGEFVFFAGRRRSGIAQPRGRDRGVALLRRAGAAHDLMRSGIALM